MRIINLSEQNTILNRFVSELRDVDIQKDSMRFRRNVERIGETMAYEISKTLNYAPLETQTPLGTSITNVSSWISGMLRQSGECFCFCLQEIQRKPSKFSYPHRIHRFSTNRE